MRLTQISILIVLVLLTVIIVFGSFNYISARSIPRDILFQGPRKLSLPEGAKTYRVMGSLFKIAYAPDGNRLAFAGDIGVLIYDAQTGEEFRRFKHTDVYGRANVYGIAFSPDGSTLASGSEDETIRLWDVATGEPKGVLTGHAAQVFSVVFSPDGGTLASGSGDGRVRLWDGITGEYLKNLTGHGQRAVYSLAFSPDGSTLACATYRGVKFWDTTTGQATTSFAGDEVESIAYSPDGTTLASSGSGPGPTIRLWDVAAGIHKQTLTDRGWIKSVVFSPDGSILASGSLSGRVILWDLHQ